MPRYIYHIAGKASWERQKPSGLYRHESLDVEGFIHCSNENQWKETLDRFFTDRRRGQLVLLKIDVERLNTELRDEQGELGQLFPHVYGALNVPAVVEVRALS